MHLLDFAVASGHRYHFRTIICPFDAFRDNHVTLSTDPALGCACLPDDTTELGKRVCIRRGAQLMEELRRPLDVGEEEGHGAGREVVAHAP